MDAYVLNSISQETTDELKRLIVAKIVESAKDGSLINSPELLAVLFRWKDWASSAEPRKWVEDFMSDKEKLVLLLSKFLTETESHTVGDAVGRIHHTLSLKNLANFFDLNMAAELLGQFGENEPLEERLGLTVRTFNRQYHIYKDGKDPDSPFASLGID